MGVEISGASPWRLDLEAVDNTVADALRQRRALLRPDADRSHLPRVWRDRAGIVLGWPRRTHFAPVITGLLARATDKDANPSSLQRGHGALGMYSAASVWAKFYDRAARQISVNGLKRHPFVNGLYDQKRKLERDWADNENAREVSTIVDWMDEVALMTPEQARTALWAFLLEVPDAVAAVDGVFTPVCAFTPRQLFDMVCEFLNGDAEDGRRAQAFVAACLETMHPGQVSTPRSVNDPSRRSPGDVYAYSGELAVFAEAKWKTVTVTDVEQFGHEVAARVPGAIAIYAALVNADSGKPLAGIDDLVSDHTGILMRVYDAPEPLLRDALAWAGRPFAVSATAFLAHFLRFLQHIGVAAATVQAFLDAASALGVAFAPNGPDGPDAV